MSSIWILGPTLLYVIVTYLRLNFLSLKSYATVKDSFTKHQLSNQNSFNYLYQYVLNVFSALFLLLSGYTVYSIGSEFSISGQSLSILLILSVVVASNYFSNVKGNDSQIVFSVLLLVLVNLILLSSYNLYQFYIILEIGAYVNLLFLSLVANTLKPGQFYQNTVAIIISFILNFVTSIVMFIAILLITWTFSYPTWSSVISTEPSVVTSILVSLAVVLKLGAGPWLAGNYHAYAGYTLPYLVVYTIVMLVAVTPVLLTLVAVLGNLALVAVSALALILYISQNISSVTSLKSLFAFSTVIVYAYLLLMLLV